MIPWHNRMATRLACVIATAFVTVGIASAALLVASGRQQVQTAADSARVSAQAAAAQQILAALQREAEWVAAPYEHAQQLGQIAAAQLTTASNQDAVAQGRPRPLLRLPEGDYGSVGNADRADTWAPASAQPHSAAFQRDLRDSARVDGLFGPLLSKSPEGVAIYAIRPTGLTRYYPSIDLAAVTPADFPITVQPFFDIATPARNPARNSAWTKPYEGPAGQGLLVTTSTPMYEGNTFRGVVGLDMSLNRLGERLDAIRPTPNAFAFVVNAERHLITATPNALPQISQLNTPTLEAAAGMLVIPRFSGFGRVAAALDAGQHGLIEATLYDDPVFVSYAPLRDLGWSVVIVTPVRELTTGATRMRATISETITTSTRIFTATLLAGLVVAMVLVVVISSRLVRPLSLLSEATQAVGQGQLRIAVPARGQDEIARLIRSFNTMVTDLSVARIRLGQEQEQLEQAVEERTRVLAATVMTLQTTLQERDELVDQVRTLAHPVIPVLHDLLVTPLIGAFDAPKIARFGEVVLRAVAQHRAAVVLIDLTGALLSERESAIQLLNVARSVALLGCQAVLVGIRPDLAESLVATDIELDDVQTFGNVASALRWHYNAR